MLVAKISISAGAAASSMSISAMFSSSDSPSKLWSSEPPGPSGGKSISFTYPTPPLLFGRDLENG